MNKEKGSYSGIIGAKPDASRGSMSGLFPHMVGLTIGPSMVPRTGSADTARHPMPGSCALTGGHLGGQRPGQGQESRTACGAQGLLT